MAKQRNPEKTTAKRSMPAPKAAVIRGKALIQKFDQQGEKTGWNYITLSAETAAMLHPGKKTAFRVKGHLDNYALQQVTLLPMGDGSFILPLNTQIRKAIRKNHGATVQLQLEKDDSPLALCAELLDCLEDEPVARKNFEKLPPSHQRYFSNWILSAKTEGTRIKRITQTVNAMLKGLSFSEMLHSK